MKISFDVGKTGREQDVRLFAERGPAGDWRYALLKHPDDDCERRQSITILTEETMAHIARAVAYVKTLQP